MKWKDIEFELMNMENKLVLRAEVSSGSILIISSAGVRSAVCIGGALGFDLVGIGKLKFYKGSCPSHMISSWCDKNISSALLNDVEFNLWIDKDAEQLIINSFGYNLLLIDKSGVYRFAGVGPSVGVATDEAGRLRVLR